MKTRILFLFMVVLFGSWNIILAQEELNTLDSPKPVSEQYSLAIMDLDAQKLQSSGTDLGDMLRMESERMRFARVIDYYEMKERFADGDFPYESCFSARCLAAAGKKLEVDKVICGSAKKYGDKIVVILRIINSQTGLQENSNVSEYVDLENEIQRMLRNSLIRLLSLEVKEDSPTQLDYVELPIVSPQGQPKLNGPRMGFVGLTGKAGKRLLAPGDEGGFESFPVSFNIGYQLEVRYQSSQKFQALLEFIGLVSGLESGYFRPSLTILNGFRWGDNNWEIGFGPTFRLVRKAQGFYDDQGLIGAKGVWHLPSEWNEAHTTGWVDNPYSIITQLDSRGTINISTGLLFAFGRTFNAGYLNLPVNAYVSPRLDGVLAGVSFGFNIQKRRKK